MSESAKLGQLRICVEKPLRVEEHAMHSLRNGANSEQHFHRLRAAFFTQKLWPKGTTIRVSFYPRPSNRVMASWTPIDVMKARREPDGSAAKIDPIEYKIRDLSFEDAVRKVVHERISPYCGLKFVFVPSGGNVRIGFDAGNGSWSLVGTDSLKSDKKTMNFAWLDAATIMHEFGHVLGMIHEHQNPRGNPIEWNIPVVDAWATQTQGWNKQTTYSNIIQHYSLDQINGSKYDPGSIMMYFFPAKMTTDHKGTNINMMLSPTDVIYINKLYPGGLQTPAEFYKKAYGESLSGSPAKNFGKMPWMLLWLIPLILVIVIGLVWLGWRFRKKRSGRYN